MPQRGNTVAETLFKALQFFENRPCLGVRNFTEDSLPYHWYTCKEVLENSLTFGVVIRKLLPSRSFVGIAAENRLEWFLADYGCVLMNMIT